MISIGGKIPVQIHPIFLVTAGLIGWLNSMSVVGTLIWMGVIFVSILVHEFGHALTALAFGQKVQIELVALGGLTSRRGAPLNFWKNFIVVLNGPLFGFLLGVLAFFLIKLVPEKMIFLQVLLTIIMYVNFFWTAVNLLPVQPLDGGQLFTIILEAFLGVRGLRIAFFLSMVIASLLSLLFFVYQAFIAGAIFLLFAFESYRSWAALRGVSKEDRSENFQQLLQQAIDHVALGRETQAEEELIALRSSVKSGVIFSQATYQLAALYDKQGKKRQAYELLQSLNGRLSAEGTYLLFKLACDLKEWQEASPLGIEVFQVRSTYEVAQKNAEVQEALGHARQADGWRQRAEQLRISK